MPLTITVRFLTGRAHLHPWQTHHSEGRVDWPPSPWRLLRAIVAVAGRGLTTLPLPDYIVDPGKTPRRTGRSPQPVWPPAGYVPLPDEWSQAESDEVPISRLARLLSELSSSPSIWLPKTSGGHTRQYFPLGSPYAKQWIEKSGSAVFDTFAVIRKDQPLLFHWPDVTLNVQGMADLKLILGRMTYFGRAESWCQARGHDVAPEQLGGITTQGLDPTHWACVCLEDGGRPAGQEYRDYTLERRLAALPLAGDGPETLSSQAVQLLPRTKPIAADSRPKAEEDFRTILRGERPAVLLLRCLLRESGQDIKDGLERPVGTRWIHYAVPRAIYHLPRPAPRPRPRHEDAVDLVRYALNTGTVHRAVLPPVTDTLLVADRFRNAVLAIHGRIHGKPSPVGGEPHPRNLCGHEADASICQDHDHAFWWPTDEDDDGFIDHVTVYARGGFAAHEVDALRRLTRIRQRGGRLDLLVTPTVLGRADMYKPWLPSRREGNEEIDQRASVFVSASPYFCPVHLSHGRTGGGRLRPVTPVIRDGLLRQGIISDPGDVETIRELVFDYDPESLSAQAAAVASGDLASPVPPRQFFPAVAAPASYPPLAQASGQHVAAYPGACVKDPDHGHPFGLSVGLFVNRGTRFVRALSFCRHRRDHQVKGHGRMLEIRFRVPRPRRPFALGSQCHYGLGLFVPAREGES